MAMTSAPHIKRDDRGVAWIDETNVKVIEVVLDRLAYGWSPEGIHFQHPRLSLAQIYAALTYYYDNQGELTARSRASRTKCADSGSRRASLLSSLA